MKEKIKKIVGKVAIGEIEDCDELLINSIEFLEVVCDLEQAFSIVFKSQDVLWENFNSIEKIECIVKQYVDEKRQ